MLLQREDPALVVVHHEHPSWLQRGVSDPEGVVHVAEDRPVRAEQTKWSLAFQMTADGIWGR